MNTIELRVANLDFTSTDDKELVVEGIVNDYNWSQTLGARKKFKERIEKGAFTRAITRALNHGKIDFLSEHDPNKVLSSTANNSLTLWEDDNKGLCMRAVICPTSWGKDTFELIKFGIIKSMSFGFNVIKDEWTNTRSEVANRVVKELNLIEVSAVRNPAYLSSAISARGMELVEDVDIPVENVNVSNEEIQVTEPKVTEIENNETQNVEKLMEKFLNQFEQMLSNYVEKKSEPKKEEEEPQKEEEPTEDNKETDNNEVIKTEEVVKEETEVKEEPPVVEQEEIVKEEVVEKTPVKSEIDYAIELLSKYKQIQELQR